MITKHECAVIMAYTGVCMLQGDDLKYFYDYVEKLLGKPVWTHELAEDGIDEMIKEKSKEDFLRICKEAV